MAAVAAVGVEAGGNAEAEAEEAATTAGLETGIAHLAGTTASPPALNATGARRLSQTEVAAAGVMTARVVDTRAAVAVATRAAVVATRAAVVTVEEVVVVVVVDTTGGLETG